MLDIIICGGGPVGSRVACELSNKGHRVAVLEKRNALGEEVCCTGIVSLECVQNFEIPEGLIIRQFSSAKVFSPAGNMLEVLSPKPVACMIDRGSFDVFMSEQAVKSGAHLRCGTEAKCIEIKKNAVEVAFESDGKTGRLEAKAVVIASGAISRLGNGAGFIPEGDIAMGAQSEVSAPNLKDIEIYTGYPAPGFFAWLVPTFAGRALAGLLTRKNAVVTLGRLLDILTAKKKVTERGKAHFRPIALQTGARTYGERVLVVGGAAGQVKPATGGGIYYGLLSADIAADVLHQAIEKSDFSAKSLSAYEVRWKRKLGREMMAGRFLRRIYEHLNTTQIDSLLSMIKSSGICRDFINSSDIFFDWHGKSLVNLVKHSLRLSPTGGV